MNFLLDRRHQFLNILRQVVWNSLDVWLLNCKVVEDICLPSWNNCWQVGWLHAVEAKWLSALCVHSVEVTQFQPVELLQVVTIYNSDYSTERGLEQTFVQLRDTSFNLLYIFFLD